MSSPICKQIASIPYPHENKQIRAFIMFNGMELDQDLNGSVSYDLEIIGPKGDKISEFHNLQALHRKIPNRFFLQKADQAVTFEFCPDKNEAIEKGERMPVFPGTYVINAYLKDHVSGKDLQLSSTLEVQPKK